MMSKDISNFTCNNTDCDGKINSKLYTIELKEDFDYTICFWCGDCVRRDKDMIENILNNDLKLIAKLNKHFDIR